MYICVNGHRSASCIHVEGEHRMCSVPGCQAEAERDDDAGFAAALAQARREAEADRDRYDRALQSLTPGGSEFVHDPERCVAFVRQARDAEMKALLRAKVAPGAQGEDFGKTARIVDALPYALRPIGRGAPRYLLRVDVEYDSLVDRDEAAVRLLAERRATEPQGGAGEGKP